MDRARGEVNLRPAQAKLGAAIEPRLERDQHDRPGVRRERIAQPVLFLGAQVARAVRCLRGEEPAAHRIRDRWHVTLLKPVDEVVEHGAGEG